MSPMLRALGIDQLDPEERITLAQEIWDSLADEREQIPLTDVQRTELNRRLAAHEADASLAVPWEVVRERVVTRIRREA